MTSDRERLHAELVVDPAELAAVEDEWRELAVGAGNPFVTPEWFYVWLGAWGGAFEPFVIVVRGAGGQVCGVLPLARSVARRRELRFPSVGDFFELLVRPGDAEAAADAVATCLRSLRPRWRRITLHRVEPNAGWVEALLGGGSPFRATQTGGHELSFLDLRGLTWESYLGARSSNFRAQIRRNLRALERQHAVRFRETARETELADDLDTLLTLHRRRRAGRGSAFDDPRFEAIVRGFAARALEQGWLRLSTLEVDDTPVASLYGWHLGSRYNGYQMAFDPEWSQASVGRVALAHAIRTEIEAGTFVFDMLLGDETYKDRFGARVRRAVDLTITSATDPIRALLVGEQVLRRIVRRVRKPVRRATQRLPHRTRARRV